MAPMPMAVSCHGPSDRLRPRLCYCLRPECARAASLVASTFGSAPRKRCHAPVPLLGTDLSLHPALLPGATKWPARRTPNRAQMHDVLVVGGGNAGCAAAIAAARHGARTLLIERYGFLGGTATAAMVGPWMTFHSGEDRIVGGIAQEIVERLDARRRLARTHRRLVRLRADDHAVRSRGSQSAALRDDARSRRDAVAARLLLVDALLDGETRRGRELRDGRRRAQYRAARRHRRNRRRVRRGFGRRSDAAGRRARARAAGQLDVSAQSRRSRTNSPPTCACIPIKCARRSSRTSARAPRADGRRRVSTSCGSRRAPTASSTFRASWSRFSSRRIRTK